MEYIYAALFLHKLGKEINEENLKSIFSAVGTNADESKIKSLVAGLKNVNIEKELEKPSLISAEHTSSSTPKQKEEIKEEKKEAVAEGLSALFD